MPTSSALPTPRRRDDPLGTMHPNAAGIDIGSEALVVAVPPDRDHQSVRAFRSFTADLENLVAWLLQCGIDTVAMESTGVYGIPLYDLLEQHGIRAVLVHAQHAKTVPGRKTDWHDAQWLQKLHTVGLLHASFRPDAEIRVLRTLLRHRAQRIEHRAPHRSHIQQALKQMNLQRSEVLSDIMGTTGQAILRAIIAGERDPVVLARFRNPACKSSEELIAKALTGTWQDEQRVVLTQSLAVFDCSTTQRHAGATQMEPQMRALAARHEPVEPLAPLPATKPNAKSKNQPNMGARLQLARITGVDLVAVTGLAASTVPTISSEIGTDRRTFPTVKHVCAWLGLAPHNDISGGKVLRRRTRKVVNRAAQAFRMAAQSGARSATSFGAFFRSMRARRGPQQAIVATAHKLARVVYHLLTYREAFDPKQVETDEHTRLERERRRLARRAEQLGYVLVQAPDVQACAPTPPP